MMADSPLTTDDCRLTISIGHWGLTIESTIEDWRFGGLGDLEVWAIWRLASSACEQ
jgi:hypothetical protein